MKVVATRVNGERKLLSDDSSTVQHMQREDEGRVEPLHHSRSFSQRQLGLDAESIEEMGFRKMKADR